MASGVAGVADGVGVCRGVSVDVAGGIGVRVAVAVGGEGLVAVGRSGCVCAWAFVSQWQLGLGWGMA
ncbi:MAG: hypothetical protein HC853_18330 [Anaerolineae bacterium]|nr:hypothetical protein [Anaerolineae bacterium]